MIKILKTVKNTDTKSLIIKKTPPCKRAFREWEKNNKERNALKLKGFTLFFLSFATILQPTARLSLFPSSRSYAMVQISVKN